MKILTDKNIRRLFCEIILCVIIFVVLAAFFMQFESASLFIFAASFCMALTILGFCCGCFCRQNKIIEDAAAHIAAYSSGDTSVRIDCDDEGELNKLFHEINSLAAILNAHAEHELRSKEFLKNTISDISHQLKTPLAALNIYNGIMQDDTTDLSEIKEFVNLSEQELDRIETLVQNLLKITKLDAGTAVTVRKEENVYEMLEEIKEHFAFRAKQEEKQIILAGDAAASFSCDRIWLTEAMENIVKNALDHTAPGDKINLGCKSLSSVVQITVKDNGSGIHPEDLHHIFKRFYRSRFSKDTQGVGLGLSLAKSIIEAHNGTIEVDSEPGGGTNFVINFLIPTKL
ncbi:MAG: HAMP domain-containing histidine kinase [Lachnospiraceae bacterium]|nr:HAMP domain-containing histidine kinase [Lachnospiraceae bacterium]